MALEVRIFEDTFAIKKPEWCWRKQWMTGYDSAFGLLMKFALLNALTGKEVATQFVSRQCGKRSTLLRSVNVDLRDHRLFDLAEMARALRTDVRSIEAGFVTNEFPDLSSSSTELKWCELCMAWGLHLPVTQMHTVSQCPIHNRPLLAWCVRCKIPIPYTINAAAFDTPFQCPKCQYDLAPRLRLARKWVPQIRTEHVSRICMMRKYVRGHASVTAAVQRLPILAEHCVGLQLPGKGEQQAPGYLAFVAQVLAELESNQGQACLPLSPLSVARYGLVWSGPESIGERCTGVAGEHQFHTAEEMAIVRQTYRAVKRRILHQLGGHRQCIASACRHLWWDMRGARTASFCPTAMSFIRWRMLWEGCGTPRYLDAKGKPLEFFGILGWLQARPAPYPDDWPVPRKEWMLTHIFSSVCLASYEALTNEAEQDGGGTMIWDTKTTAPQAVTQWVMANSADGAQLPVIFTPARGLLRGLSPGPATRKHHTWHADRLARIVR